MEEFGKSALIAIVGMMASAVIVAGGAVMRPDGVVLPGKPAVPLASFVRGPEQPALAFNLPVAPPVAAGPEAAAASDAAGVAPGPRMQALPPPSLKGSARPLSPERKPPLPLSSFRRGPEESALALNLPAAPPDVAAPAPTGADERIENAVPPSSKSANLPSLKGSARPLSPERKPPLPLSSFNRGPEQPALALNLPAAPPDIAAPTPTDKDRSAESAAAPRAESARLPSLRGSARPLSPERKPPPPLSSFDRGPEQPALALNLPQTPPGLAPAETQVGINSATVLPPRVAEARLPVLEGSARPPSPDDKPGPPPAHGAAPPGQQDAVVVATLSPPTGSVGNGEATSPASNSGMPAWRRYAALAPADTAAPMIAIIIDDVGLNTQRMARAIALPHPLTLAILPYAENIAPWAAKARAAGHELMLHLPMEPSDPNEDPGPHALLADLDPAEIARRIEWNLSRFDGYVGVNNHMGSRFTASAVLMQPLIHRLAQRGLLFIDSLTTNASVGEELARAEGVPTAARDIFLDNDLEAARIRAQLAKVERCALRKGYCIAIGHPHPETLSVLERWLPGLAARGFVLAPVSAIVARHMTG